AMKRLARLAQLLLLRLGGADRRREPFRVRREGLLRAERDRLRRAVGDRRHAQFVLAVRPVDAVRQPAAVRGQAAVVGGGPQPFPLTEVRRRRRLQSALKEKHTDEERQHFHLKISFGIFTWTPTLPSTSWVMWTLPATLVN